MTDSQWDAVYAVYAEVSKARDSRTLTKERFDPLLKRAEEIVGEEGWALEGLYMTASQLEGDV